MSDDVTNEPRSGIPQIHEDDANCASGASPPRGDVLPTTSSTGQNGSVEPTGDHADVVPTVKLATCYMSQAAVRPGVLP
jgi:hypothetical protein